MAMNFKNIKKQILEASDLSKKGSIDEPVRDLVNYINELDDYVTTSSCSGRAILYTLSVRFLAFIFIYLKFFLPSKNISLNKSM